jgi:hypothetical protein
LRHRECCHQQKDFFHSVSMLSFPNTGHHRRNFYCFYETYTGIKIACSMRMPKLERVRDFVTTPPSVDYFGDKLADGWQLVAIEWERGAEPAGPPIEDIPFGLRVASDCRRLEENPEEIQVLMIMLEVLVQDGPLSTAAKQINDRGYRTRSGEPWTRTALFYLWPRLIEVGPRLCTSEEWVERRKHLFNVA